jgi:predicted ATPase
MPDEHQVKVVEELQKLYEALKIYEPKSASGSWFSFGKKEVTESTVKGLYIYGSVGGGKTMLMDMFFDCCKVFALESNLGIFEFYFHPILDREEKASSLQFLYD